jgi:hypothetical protein
MKGKGEVRERESERERDIYIKQGQWLFQLEDEISYRGQ